MFICGGREIMYYKPNRYIPYRTHTCVFALLKSFRNTQELMAVQNKLEAIQNLCFEQNFLKPTDLGLFI